MAARRRTYASNRMSLIRCGKEREKIKNTQRNRRVTCRRRITTRTCRLGVRINHTLLRSSYWMMMLCDAGRIFVKRSNSPVRNCNEYVEGIARLELLIRAYHRSIRHLASLTIRAPHKDILGQRFIGCQRTASTDDATVGESHTTANAS